MQNSTTTKNFATRSLSQQELKNLRRAEARHRIELLQEAKLLHDHLADFWDDGVDLSRHRHKSDTHFYSAELEKILGSDQQTPGERVEINTLTPRPMVSADLSSARIAPADDALSVAQHVR